MLDITFDRCYYHNYIKIHLTCVCRQLEQENEHLGHQFRCNIAKQFQEVENNVSFYTEELQQFCAYMKNDIGTYLLACVSLNEKWKK